MHADSHGDFKPREYNRSAENKEDALVKDIMGAVPLVRVS